MSFVLPMSFLACVAAPQAVELAQAELEFALVLSQLAAPELATRADAQRRLAGLVHEGRIAALAAFLRGADEEARARVAAALASRGGLLPVVASLAVDPDARVARVGLQALELATLAEASSVSRPSLSGDLEWLTRAASTTVRIEGALLSAPAAELLPILLAAGGHPLELAFDPDRGSESRLALPGGEGDLWRWLSALAQVRELNHRLVRRADGRATLVVGGAPAVAEEPDHAPVARHADFLARCVRASLDLEPVRRLAGCGALASSGWSAAQAWIEQRAWEGDEAAVAALARLASARAPSPALGSRAAVVALRRMLEAAQVEEQLARGASLAAALGATGLEPTWPQPAESRTARLLQLVAALHAPLAPRSEPPATEALPPLLGALTRPEADAIELSWCWRVAARHGLAVPARVAQLHGERLAALLAAAGEASRLPELARATGVAPPAGAAPFGVPSEVLLAAWCATGDTAAARGLLERLCRQSPLVAAKAWRAARLGWGSQGTACAEAVVGDGAWLAEEAAREEFLLLVLVRASTDERLRLLDAARLDHLAGDPAGVAAREAWLERCEAARQARRSQLERADAIVADLRAAGAEGAAWSFIEAVRAKVGDDERRASSSPQRSPSAARQAVGAAWFDPVPGRSLGEAR